MNMAQDGLEAAIALAACAHAGQVDKGGAPYILHPLRVMLACETHPQRIAAILHDVVEDCGIELSDLRTRFGPDVADAVDALTRRGGEAYNIDVGRLGRAPTTKDNQRLGRYARAVLLDA